MSSGLRGDPAEATVTEEFRAHGILEHEYGRLDKATLWVTRQPYVADPDAHRCVVDVGSHRDRELHDFLSISRSDALKFRGTMGGVQSAKGADVEAELRWLNASNWRVNGQLSQLDVNLTEPAPSPPDRQFMVVRFTPTAVLEPEISFPAFWPTGEIKRFEGDKEARRSIQRLQTTLGLWELSLQYRWEDVMIGGSKASVRVPCPSAVLALAKEECVTDVGGLVTAALEQLEPVCDVLSFLSRRLVRPWEVTLSSRRDEGEKWYLDSRRILRPISTEEAESRWPLVWGARLPEDGLAQVADRLTNSPYRDCVIPTTHGLIGYWQREYIETGVFTTFSALETLVNGISRIDGTLFAVSDEQFTRISAEVRRAIKAEAVKKGLDPEVRKQLYEKIPELQRRSLVPRVCGLVDRWKVEWRDLFPPGISLDEELRAAYHRRSRLVHEGQSGDLIALMRDTRRVHALTERMVYKILEVPDEWTEPRSHEYASWHSSMDLQ